MRRFRRGFRGDSRGQRGLHDLSDLGVGVLLREVPRGESLRVGAARIEALLEEEAHDVGLEREVDGGDGLAVPHGGVQRGVAVGVDELEEVLGGAGVEVALAGLQVQAVDRVEKRLVVKGRNRGNRVAEGGEVAGGAVFEEMVAETDRRFARLEGEIESKKDTSERACRLLPWEISVEKRSQSRRSAAQCRGVRPKLSG